MQIKEFEGKTKSDLEKMLVEARTKLRDLRNQIASNQLKQMHLVKLARQKIAKLKTALHQLDQKSKPGEAGPGSAWEETK
ncbi:MAG: 50S ribosomal protein L29 [Candidatus Uhrbacteria bacterium]